MQVRSIGIIGCAALLSVPTLLWYSSPALADPADVANVSDFSSVSGSLELSGSAAISGTALMLTPAKTHQAGAAWWSRRIDAGREWHSSFRASMKDAAMAGAADGFVFVLSGSRPSVGVDGGQLGYGGLAGTSVAVEFDTHRNLEFGEADNNHIAIDADGDATHPKSIATPPFMMSSGDFSAWIDYDPTYKTLAVFASQGTAKPATPVVSANVDLGGFTDATAGFTGSTGADYQLQSILSWRLTGTQSYSHYGKYVALGDSYQSGEGAYDYYPETDTDANMCHRSRRAYAPLLANLSAAHGLALSFWACSGSVIDDLSKTRDRDAPYNDGVADGKTAYDRLDDDTNLVTIGIGGNDMGFADTLSTCITSTLHDMLPWDWSTYSCQKNFHDKISDNLHFLTVPDPTTGLSRLQTVYSTIRSRAPYARVAVLGYPKFYADGGKSNWASDDYCAGMRISDQRWINYEIKTFNSEIAHAAASMGMQYVDIYDLPDGRELCSGSSTPFLNGIKVQATREITAKEAYHPTAYAHSLIANELNQKLNAPPPGFLFHVSPGQSVSFPQNITGGPAASFSSQWPGSDIVMTLRSPSGRIIERSTQAGDVRHLVGPTYETYLVDTPEPGNWTITLYGANVAAAGEDARVLIDERPRTNRAPNAAFSVGQTGHVVSVDASASNDPDGSILEYVWDFGDGTSATGLRASHTYRSSGSYLITLSVRDNDHGEAFASADQPVVVVPYRFAGFFDPVKPDTGVTEVNAGRAIPMKFTLGGDFGTDVLDSGTPVSVPVDCGSLAPTGDAEATATSGSSGLGYDKTSGVYSYAWKSDSRWAGTCRRFQLTLNDGSTHAATFAFR